MPTEGGGINYAYTNNKLRIENDSLKKSNRVLVDLDRSNQIVIRDLKKRVRELELQLRKSS